MGHPHPALQTEDGLPALQGRQLYCVQPDGTIGERPGLRTALV